MAPAPAPASDPMTTIEYQVFFVAGAITLLILQLIFGHCRRRSSRTSIQIGVWFVYTLSIPLVSYTFGLMQSSQAKSVLYPVMAIALFLVQGCSISVTAYDLEETKQGPKQYFDQIQQVFIYSGLFIQLGSPSILSLLTTFLWYVLAIVVVLANVLRAVALRISTLPLPSKVVADYMRDLIDSGGLQMQQGSGSDPITTQGGRYLVQYHTHFLNTRHPKANDNRTKLEPEDIITVNKIWEEDGKDRLFKTNDGSQKKDVCLSFALFHLLTRRYHGINCYEAGTPEARNFVLNELLASSSEDYYGQRAFRIIEAELGFMHDFFFTKYAAIFNFEIYFYVLFVLKTILTIILGVFVHRNILEQNRKFHFHVSDIPVESVKVDTMITIAVLGALLAMEIVQIILYLASDWALVSLACYNVRKGPCPAIMYYLLHKPIYMLRKPSLFKNWQNKIGQYSVIEGSRWHKSFPQQRQLKVNGLLVYFSAIIQMLVSAIAWKVFTCRYYHSIVGDVRLPDAVKREIASSLKFTAHDPLTRGGASLQRNGVFRQFGWTLSRGDDCDLTDIMLIWHIATNYCEIPTGHADAEETTGLNTGELRHYRQVATSLSRYSAYLMNSVPELLPGNPADTSFKFEEVMQKVTETLYHPDEDDIFRGREMANRRMLLEAFRALGSSEQEDDHTIFFKGLKLGTELEALADAELRWKVMAQFWAEIFLYVAPSDNVRGHVEHLAKGGEFITHIWALLSHAGILTRPPWQLASRSSFLPMEDVSDTQAI